MMPYQGNNPLYLSMPLPLLVEILQLKKGVVGFSVLNVLLNFNKNHC